MFLENLVCESTSESIVSSMVGVKSARPERAMGKCVIDCKVEGAVVQFGSSHFASGFLSKHYDENPLPRKTSGIGRMGIRLLTKQVESERMCHTLEYVEGILELI